MKQNIKRLTALFLALAMTMSLMCSSAWATELTGESSAEASLSEMLTDIDSAEEDDTTPEDTEESDEASDAEEDDTSTAPLPDEEPETPAEDTAEEEAAETPQEESALNETDLWEYANAPQTTRRWLYDDHNSWGSDYTILGVRTVESRSYTVEKSAKTARKDDVLYWSGQATDRQVIATGVGEGQILVQNTKSGEVLCYNVTVDAAPLTVLYLTGQSNMEGYCAKNTGYQRGQSVASTIGQVYSTYYPKNLENLTNISGITIDSSQFYTANFTPAALNSRSTANCSGTALAYPLNTLTTAGKGKTGPDGALAYQWHQLTGDKVWTINAAYGGSEIADWSPTNNKVFKRAKEFYEKANQTLDAEVSAGHFVVKHRLMFWLQGEYNMSTSVEKYLEGFQEMYLGIEEDDYHNAFSGMKELCKLDAVGIIMTRAKTYGMSSSSYQTRADITMSGARVAQYLMANKKELPDVYLVSNSNEAWVTDADVAACFKAAYPGGKLNYPAHSTLPALPKTVAEVHNDIHYSQLGHNENGLTAASNLYHILKGTSAAKNDFRWLDADGASVNQAYCVKGESTTLVVNVKPLYAPRKNLTYRMDDASIADYDVETGRLTGRKAGSTALRLYDGSTEVAAIPVYTYACETPKLVAKAVKGTKTGVRVEWKAVSGAAKYAVFRRNGATAWTGSNSWSKIGTTTGTCFIDTTAAAGKTYSYTVRCLDSKNGYASGYDHFGMESLGVSFASSSKGVTVSWGKVSGAAGYSVYRDGKKLKDVTGTSYTDTKAKTNGAKYTYTICPYGTDKQQIALCGSVLNYYVSAPTISSAKSGAKKKLTVKWKKNAKATGYQIQYGLNSNLSDGKTLTVKKNSTLAATISKLQSGKTYYVRIRAYKTSGGVTGYSSYSKTLKAKVK